MKLNKTCTSFKPTFK
uniref:Uncharacterized protein n=1 Tax=Arundo donax TaxID=35708 RepID=A0A0A9F8P3_ARUDO